MSLKLTKSIIFFDLETTGPNVLKDKIIEIAAIKLHMDGSEEEREWRVNPGMPIPPASTAIHGIRDEDVKDAPLFSQIAQEVLQFFRDCDLGGYNHIKFDIPLLIEEFSRLDLAFDLKNRRLIDAQKIFFFMEPRNLTAAYRFYCGKELEDAHSAMADTKATLEVLKAQIDKYRNVVPPGQEKAPITENLDDIHELSAGNMVDLAGRIVYNKDKEKVFNFGKHKGKKVSEVFSKEPAYYDWMMKNDFPADTKKHLTEIKLSMSKMI